MGVLGFVSVVFWRVGFVGLRFGMLLLGTRLRFWWALLWICLVWRAGH